MSLSVKEVIKREKNKKRFFRKYYQSCVIAFDFALTHSDWKTTTGRILVGKARKKIPYSKNTASMDIFWSLKAQFQDYKRLNKNG